MPGHQHHFKKMTRDRKRMVPLPLYDRLFPPPCLFPSCSCFHMYFWLMASGKEANSIFCQEEMKWKIALERSWLCVNC